MGETFAGLRRKLVILVRLMTGMWSEENCVDAGLVDGRLGDEKKGPVYQIP